MVNTAQKGRRLEHEVRRLFEDAGWDVLRAAGSKGTVAGFKADLVASKQARGKSTVYIVMMQAKRIG